MTDDKLRAALDGRVRQVLTDWGLDLPTSDPPHGWRCQYPALSDPATCGHVDELVSDLVAALAASVPDEGPTYVSVEEVNAVLDHMPGGRPPGIVVLPPPRPDAPVALDALAVAVEKLDAYDGRHTEDGDALIPQSAVLALIREHARSKEPTDD